MAAVWDAPTGDACIHTKKLSVLLGRQCVVLVLERNMGEATALLQTELSSNALVKQFS